MKNDHFGVRGSSLNIYWHPKYPETQFFFTDLDTKTNLI